MSSPRGAPVAAAPPEDRASAAEEIARLRQLAADLAAKREKQIAARGDDDGPAGNRAATLAHWMLSNGDLTVNEVGLGPSDTSIEALLQEYAERQTAVKGMDQYAIGGELRRWMTRAADRSHTVPALPVQWGADAEREIDSEIIARVRAAVEAEDAQRRDHVSALLLRVAKQLGILSFGRDFGADAPAAGEVAQHERLAEAVDDWAAHVARHGHQLGPVGTGAGSRPGGGDPSLPPGVRVLEHGIRAAAEAQGLVLSKRHLDQVLHALYEQRAPPGAMSDGRVGNRSAPLDKPSATAQAAKVLAGRAGPGSPVTSRAQVAGAAGLCTGRAAAQLERLHAELAATSAEAERLRAKLRDHEANPQRREDAVERIEEHNALVEVAAAAMAKERVEKLKGEVQRLRAGFSILKRRHGKAEERTASLEEENQRLREEVGDIARQWRAHRAAQAALEADRERLYGGQADDLSRAEQTLSAIASQSAATLINVVSATDARVDATAAAETAIREVATTITGDMARVALRAAAGQLRGQDLRSSGAVYACAAQWSASVLAAAGVPEGVKTAAAQVGEAAAEGAARCDTHEAEVDHWPTTDPGAKNLMSSAAVAHRLIASVKDQAAGATSLGGGRHVDALVRRLDGAAGELGTVHREARLMRRTVGFLCDGVGALLDGTFDDAVHGLTPLGGLAKGTSVVGSPVPHEVPGERFPPPRVLAGDAGFRLGWTEELRRLETLYDRLVATLGDRRGASGDNPLLRVLERMAVAAAPAAPARALVATGEAPVDGTRSRVEAMLAQDTFRIPENVGAPAVLRDPVAATSPGAHRLYQIREEATASRRARDAARESMEIQCGISSGAVPLRHGVIAVAATLRSGSIPAVEGVPFQDTAPLIHTAPQPHSSPVSKRKFSRL